MQQTSRRSFWSFAPFLAAASLAAASLGGCSVAEPIAYHPIRHDARPHPGVAHAHKYPIHGVDVSKWQGQIDWRALKASGVKFAFIKATEGGDHVDERFAQNWEGAKAAGVAYGAYHFVYWCRPASEQAAWFQQHIPADPNALPPVLDVEWNAYSRTCPGRISPELARRKIAIMLEALQKHTGKRPIIYTDITFNKDVLEGHFQEYPFWVRSTAADPKMRYADRPWAIWQYTTTGRLPGIRGNVDRNTFHGTREQWLAFMDIPQPGRAPGHMPRQPLPPPPSAVATNAPLGAIPAAVPLPPRPPEDDLDMMSTGALAMAPM